MTDINENAIVVQGLKKSFVLPHEQHSGIKQYLINLTRSKKGYETQNVLLGLDFEIKKGEFFGIVGRNGSGKSTLLKLLAGIYSPDEGSISVDGTLIPFIELGVGFNPELTGRENIFLNGALLGFSRKQMEEKYGKIVEFSELERFMDQKLKNYSSGMQVRLAFSIAIQAQGDILLLDEVLAVGDAAFQQKCFEYFSRLKDESRTVVLISHDMSAIKRFCKNAILLEKGEIVAAGTSEEIGDAYENMFILDAQREDDQNDSTNKNGDIFSEKFMKLHSCKVNRGKTVRSTEKVRISVSFVANENITHPIDYGVNIINKAGVIVFATGTAAHQKTVIEGVKMGQRLTFTHVIENHMTDDKYHVNLAIKNSDTNELIYKKARAAEFLVRGWPIKHSLIQASNSLGVEKV